VTPTLLWLKNYYWIHRDVIRVAAPIAGLALVQSVLVLWIARRLRELGLMRERMSRLADGLALLTDTTEAGLSTILREVQQGARKAPVRASSASRSAVSKRVLAAARKGSDVAEIASDEALSESEVRLHLKLAPLGRNPLANVQRAG
jgi:hypothetical protein